MADESRSNHQDQRAIVHLRAAIQTARQAADDAERRLNHNTSKPDAAARAVLNALAWGHANASSNIETALSCIEDAHGIRAFEASEGPAPAGEQHG